MRMPTNAHRRRSPTGTGRQSPASAGPRALLSGGVARLAGLARRHWLVSVLLVAGLALRIMAAIAYRPALLYIDSIKYLLGAYPGNDPPGYQMLLKFLTPVMNLDFIAALQHLLGLGMAVVIYLVLLRRGAPRWLAALATAPVLLDAYQLEIEQTIMPDVLFEALIVAGLAALLWHRLPPRGLAVTAGLALGASATMVEVGEVLVLPAVAFLMISIPGWRRKLTLAAVFCIAFALPILGASYKNYVSIHRFSLAPYAPGTIYGRMAAAANCATLQLPAYEHALCPNAAEKAHGPDWLDHGIGSPIKTFSAPPGMHKSALVNDFATRVVAQQPMRVLSAVATDAGKLFAVDRVTSAGDTPISRWQFQLTYPQFPPYVTVRAGVVYFGALTPYGTQTYLGTATRFGGGSPAVTRPLAEFLRGYQLRGGYTPGPLLLLSVIAGLAGTLTAARRRASPARRDAARACLLFFGSGVTILLISDLFEFSWRYQLPAVITLPPAAAFGLMALFSRRDSGAGDEPAPATASGQAAAGVAARHRAEAAVQGRGGRQPETPARYRAPAS